MVIDGQSPRAGGNVKIAQRWTGGHGGGIYVSPPASAGWRCQHRVSLSCVCSCVDVLSTMDEFFVFFSSSAGLEAVNLEGTWPVRTAAGAP